MKEKITDRDPVKQNAFRKALYNESMAIYGCSQCYASHQPHKRLTASHIKPYKICELEGNKAAEFDINNGLLLSKDIDSYFDEWELTFDDNGDIIFSNDVPDAIQQLYSSCHLDEKIYNSVRKENMNTHRSIFLYKYYIAPQYQQKTIDETLEAINVPYFDCGIKIYANQCIFNEAGVWNICPINKVKNILAQRAGYSFIHSNDALMTKLLKNESYVLSEIPKGLNTPHETLLFTDKTISKPENYFKICSTNYDREDGKPERFVNLLRTVFHNQEKSIVMFRYILSSALTENKANKGVLLYGNMQSIELLCNIIKGLLGSYVYEYSKAARILNKKASEENFPNARLLIVYLKTIMPSSTITSDILNNTFFQSTILNVDRYVPLYVTSSNNPRIDNSCGFNCYPLLDDVNTESLLSLEGGKIISWLTDLQDIAKEVEQYKLFDSDGLSDYSSEEQSIKTWLNERCVLDQSLNTKVRIATLYNDYCMYSANTSNLCTLNMFSRHLKRLISGRNRDSMGYYYCGIMLKELLVDLNQ